MVRILAAQIVNMQRHQRVIDQPLEKLMRQIDSQLMLRNYEGFLK